ncbi:MAG: hypothetical protein NVS4B2_34500 [Chloroflexota bacterium]
MSLTCGTARLMVSEYIDGELDAEAGKLLEAHLQTCANCPPLYAALIQVRRRLHQLPRVAVPPPMRQRIGRHLQRLARPIVRDDDKGGDR